jgi:hypothetical protein
MDSSTVDRRTVLLGSAAGVAALAGCADSIGGDGDNSGGGLPSYTQLVTPGERGESLAVSLDLEAASGLEGIDASQGNGGESATEDGLLGIPAVGFFVLAFGQLPLATAGLDVLVEDAEPFTPEEDEQSEDGPVFDTELTDELLLTQGLVLRGDIDTGEIDEILTTTPEDGGFSRQQAFEQVDTTDGFKLYETVEGTEQVVGVGGDAIFVTETTDELEQLVGARNGEQTRTAETSEAFEWVNTEVSGGYLRFTLWGDDGVDESTPGGDENSSRRDELTDQAVFEAVGTTIAVASTVAGDSGETQVDLALVVDGELTDEAQSVLEDELGVTADDVEFEFDEDRLLVSGTYSESGDGLPV